MRSYLARSFIVVLFLQSMGSTQNLPPSLFGDVPGGWKTEKAADWRGALVGGASWWRTRAGGRGSSDRAEHQPYPARTLQTPNAPSPDPWGRTPPAGELRAGERRAHTESGHETFMELWCFLCLLVKTAQFRSAPAPWMLRLRCSYLWSLPHCRCCGGRDWCCRLHLKLRWASWILSSWQFMSVMIWSKMFIRKK